MLGTHDRKLGQGPTGTQGQQRTDEVGTKRERQEDRDLTRDDN